MSSQYVHITELVKDVPHNDNKADIAYKRYFSYNSNKL